MRQLDQIILKDDETDTGGIDHVGETLLEFLETIGFEVEDKLAITIREVAQINIKLADCGIKKLELEDFTYKINSKDSAIFLYIKINEEIFNKIFNSSKLFIQDKLEKVFEETSKISANYYLDDDSVF